MASRDPNQKSRDLREGEGLWVRFGGLSPLAQEHFESNNERKGFHNPPRSRGVFAFPSGYVERFLLGATLGPANISHKSVWLKDREGNRLSYSEHINYCEEIKRGPEIKISAELKKLIKQKHIKLRDLIEKDGFIAAVKRPRVFRYQGEIWHHLGEHVDPNAVLDTAGSWVKTSYQDWREAFRAERHSARREMHRDQILGGWKKLKREGALGIDPFKRYMARDHLEVFIERPH